MILDDLNHLLCFDFTTLVEDNLDDYIETVPIKYATI